MNYLFYTTQVRDTTLVEWQSPPVTFCVTWKLLCFYYTVINRIHKYIYVFHNGTLLMNIWPIHCLSADTGLYQYRSKIHFHSHHNFHMYEIDISSLYYCTSFFLYFFIWMKISVNLYMKHWPNWLLINCNDVTASYTNIYYFLNIDKHHGLFVFYLMYLSDEFFKIYLCKIFRRKKRFILDIFTSTKFDYFLLY